MAEVTEILQLKYEQRTRQQLSTLALFFDKLKFFRDCARDHHKETCLYLYKHMTLQCAEQGEDVFQYG